MQSNSILIVSNILSNMRELYQCEINLEYIEKSSSYKISCINSSVFKLIFNVLEALNNNTLNYYLEDKHTFVIF